MGAVFFYEVEMDQNDEKTGEIVLYQPEITCANFAHVGADADQVYNTTLYNLDVIQRSRI